MMERTLVTLRCIDGVVVHPNADALDLLRIGGWQVVSQKGNFARGDLCLFFEIDSILPDQQQFKFLIDKQGKNYSRGIGARLRTIKLRGEVSQGLAIPISEFPGLDVYAENLDERLGVYKYEPVDQGGSTSVNAKGAWPTWMPKTDQERIENCFDKMGTLAWSEDLNPIGGLLWNVEEKLEGSSITMYVHDGVFGVCSHNLDLKMDGSNDENMFVKSAVSQGFHLMADCAGSWAVRGELVGEGIQGNIYKLKGREICVYDVWDGLNQRYLTQVERSVFLDGLEGMGVSLYEVPYLTTGGIALPETVDEIIADANGISALHHTKREGVVWKATRTVKDRFGREYIPSFKAISREYLLSVK
jgi:RNA ligase (TIGR02306 family)